MTRTRHSLVVLLLLAFVSTAPAQRGAITVRMNLAQLVDAAGVIIHGRVVNVRHEPLPEYENVHTLVITVRVTETFKGGVEDTYSFRQYIWDPRDIQQKAGYAKGQEVLLILTAPSKSGASAPVGLEQGRFNVARDGTGKTFARNGRDNARLLEGVPARIQKKGIKLSERALAVTREHRGGAIALEELGELIRGLARPD